MAVDPYSLCPCGSGKKLKFCCSDLIGEIEKIYRLIEGDQSRAALQQTEQALKKYPKRASLLDIKAMLEMVSEQYEAAAATAAEFLAADPKNPTAHAHLALLACETGSGREAAAALQHALDLVEENLPKRVLEAIGAVAHGLLLEGNIVAARAHLWLFQGIAGSQDDRALQLLLRLNQSAGLPLLLRDHFYMQWAPEGHPAEPQHDHAQMLASQGKWLQAANLLDAIDANYPGVPEFIYNRALVHGWLGDAEQFVAGLHAYAKCNVSLDDAVEAEAVAQLLEPVAAEYFVNHVRQAYAVRSEEELLERLNRDSRTFNYQLDPEEWNEETGPPPRFSWLLLDRSSPESGENITREEVPHILGFLSYFGRQTNQQERLELITDQDERYEEALRLVAEIGGENLGESEPPVPISKTNRSESVLNWRWHFPTNTPLAVRSRLIDAERRLAILERWPSVPRPALGGQTPAAAASDPALRIPLLAEILRIEQGSNNGALGDTFTQLRAKLGLPQPTALTSEEVDLGRLPLIRVPRLDLTTLEDEPLLELYRRSAVANVPPAAVATLREILRRPTEFERVPRADAYRRLLQFEADPATALETIALARAECLAAGDSCAEWDFAEFQHYILSGAGAAASRILQHINEAHVHEPGVAETMYRTLYALGITPNTIERRTAPTAQAAPSKLWTPESEAAAAGSSQKLWVPS